MSAEESLHDVTIRENQLHRHILQSPEYLRRADQELKRQVAILYLAIALLLVFQGLFAFNAGGALPLGGVVLVSVTSFLAIVNCLLLIKTNDLVAPAQRSLARPAGKKPPSRPSAASARKSSPACPTATPKAATPS